MFCTHCGHEIGSASVCPDCGSRSAYVDLSPFVGSPKVPGPREVALERSEGKSARLTSSSESLATNVRLTSWIEALRDLCVEPTVTHEARGEASGPASGDDDSSAEGRVTLDLPISRTRERVARLVPKGSSGWPAHELFIGSHVLSGSHPGDIVLDDPYISCPHARIEVLVDGGRMQVLVEDLNSKNRTYIDGKMITKAEAPDGCTLKFARAEFVLRMGSR